MMAWADVNGASLRYELAGNGDETVVFMHESGGSLESWDETLPDFQRHFRTLRYDQRGFGLSEKIRKPFTLDEMASDIGGLLDFLGITRPCHLVGSALGTAFALTFAARNPGRVARLAVASPVTAGFSGERRTAAAVRADAIEREGIRPYVDASLSRSYPANLRGNLSRFEAYRGKWLANDPWCYAAINRMTANLDLTAELAAIDCPTLVLGATYDPQRTPEMAKTIARQIRGARYIEVASGHFMAAETPELFAHHVLTFLRQPLSAT